MIWGFLFLVGEREIMLESYENCVKEEKERFYKMNICFIRVAYDIMWLLQNDGGQPNHMVMARDGRT